ncbi:unnamed protein product [Durusdinium trenchii]|uniref:Uncharacterized protein n=1 Tax=Durusdinium trenchii TaxID=1381693 RepID=A0ABP0RRZ8_9DINO
MVVKKVLERSRAVQGRAVLFDGRRPPGALCDRYHILFQVACPVPQEVSCSPDAIAFDGMILKDIPETFFQVASTRRFTLHQQLDMLAIFIYQVLSVKGDVGGVVVDKSLRVHGGDGLDQCIAEYSNKRQLWVSSGIPLAMGNAALAAGAKHCIQEGAVYSIVETGLPFCLEDEDWPQSKDRESIKKLATLAAALGRSIIQSCQERRSLWPVPSSGEL